ncbi:MAG: peptide chain release factor N(5)-glutamine methyltransferase [Alphaproteobacteria bacterium]|nr:peptide chain release factor N(5)-glutamine methyltransferase [Alphaproteobacteria bacterium]
MQLSALYAQIRQELLQNNIPNAEMEAKRLIMHHLGLDLGDFILKFGEKVDHLSLERIQEDVGKRIKGQPLSGILQKTEFWGLEFKTTGDTLDPRPDTETLIEAVLKYTLTRFSRCSNHPLPQGEGGDPQNGEGEGIKILDLGTGTGCIPIALLSELSGARAVAVDISEKALEIARYNAQKHNMLERIEFVQGDWMKGLDDYSFDIITSNPPYIRESDIENLDKEVKNHDPILALSGGNDGLDCYKKIFFNLKKHLNSQNRAFFEIGYDQLSDVMRLVDESNLFTLRSHPDLGGIPRVVEISRGDK